MANKTHRYVKMFQSDRSLELNPARLAGVMVCTILATSVTLLAGGLSSTAGLLMLVLPLWLLGLQDAHDARHAALASLAGAGLLAFVELAGLTPPALKGLHDVAAWGGVGLICAIGLVFLQRNASLIDRSKMSQIEPTEPPEKQGETDGLLPETGPILLVSVSSLGLIGKIAGARHWLPNLRPGRAADACLIDVEGVALKEGRVVLSGGIEGEMRRVAIPNGALYVFLRGHGGAVETEMARELSQKLEQRTEFFAGLGHDLRSPLNAVLGFADIMQSELQGPLPEAYRDYPGLIRESGEMLLRLVDDMLSYARSEAGTFEIHTEPLDLAPMIEDVRRAFKPIADRSGVRLECVSDNMVWAEADPHAVRRIWDNLVSNAIKYSDAGSTVSLSAMCAGDRVSLSVSDEGSGMDAEDLANIARPFEQGRNAKGRAGTGLGLAMVKLLSDMHGGKTTIRTAPGQGTQVTVTLPAAQPQA